MSVVDDAWTTGTKGFNFNNYQERLRGAYVRRRADYLYGKNSSWNATKLAEQVTAEQAVVLDYIKTKRPLMEGTETTKPAHLDLSENLLSPPDASVLLRKAAGILVRVESIAAIVWRAVAIHPNLWKSLGPVPSLQLTALDEILDRRLHAIELLRCNVNSAGIRVATPARDWNVQGPNGPWTDGFVGRNVEYPFLPKAPFASLLSQLPEWRDVGNNMILFKSVRVPNKVKEFWLLHLTPGGTAWVFYVPSSAASHFEVFRQMFSAPREDFFDRSWLYCDMVGSLLNIAALAFAIERRPGEHTEFDKTMNLSRYVNLGPVVNYGGSHDLDILMCDDRDPFFENTDIDFDDLQVGDFVCFWNSRIYALLENGAWGNEFSHVMRIDVNAKTGAIQTNASSKEIWMAGHGLVTTSYAGMATDLVGSLQKHLNELCGSIRNGNSLPPTPKFVQWSPYEPFDPPGAWWLQIPKNVWKDDWAYKSIAEVLRSVPRTVADDPGGQGYHAPPDTNAVYFPLFEPIVPHPMPFNDDDSWRAYLRARKTNSNFRPPVRLQDLSVDGRLAIGLFYRGSQGKIPVVRPRVRI